MSTVFEEAFSEEALNAFFQSLFFNRTTHRYQSTLHWPAFEPFRNRGPEYLAAFEQARQAAHLTWLHAKLRSVRVTQLGCTLYVAAAGYYLLATNALDLAISAGVAFFGYILGGTLRQQLRELS